MVLKRLNGDWGELMQTLRVLREKIAKLESEKANLLAELEELREKAETKATSLEEEVAQLREEAESLKEMLDIL
jgi:predicted  nucleic acid-binding Zn-ribbon protein